MYDSIHTCRIVAESLVARLSMSCATQRFPGKLRASTRHVPPKLKTNFPSERFGHFSLPRTNSVWKLCPRKNVHKEPPDVAHSEAKRTASRGNKYQNIIRCWSCTAITGYCGNATTQRQRERPWVRFPTRPRRSHRAAALARRHPSP